MVAEGKADGPLSQEGGRPGAGAKRASSSEGDRPPSVSLSKSRKRSTKKRYPAGESSDEVLDGTSKRGER